jgi:tRNA G18 (ribose-2'-O)-methylase SpoU
MDMTLILHDIRSIDNVGSILRTCDGFGVRLVHACGITPHTKQEQDTRLPHVVERAEQRLHKTALGAEQTVQMRYVNDTASCIKSLKADGWHIVALEQAETSQPISTPLGIKPVALVIGNEPDGIPAHILDLSEKILEIPMSGQKESFNVSVATGIALYALSTSKTNL